MDLSSEDVAEASYIITNPPWERPKLHDIIEHLSNLKPTWLLIDAGWFYTLQSRELVRDRLVSMIALPRLKWIPNTKLTGKDDNAWYLFDKNKTEDFIKAYGR